MVHCRGMSLRTIRQQAMYKGRREVWQDRASKGDFRGQLAGEMEDPAQAGDMTGQGCRPQRKTVFAKCPRNIMLPQ